jgi:hypothetical protein
MMIRKLSQYEGPIVGPVLPHLHSIGLGGAKLTLATAYFTGRVLDSLETNAASVSVLCRLDRNTSDDWAAGYIDPPALLRFAEEQERRGAKVQVLVSPTAHAKVFLGERAALIGSANLTLRGFGGGQEIVYRMVDTGTRKQMAKALAIYAKDFEEMKLADLAAYIRSFRAAVARRPRLRTPEDRLPRFCRSRHPHLGGYGDFLSWLAKRTTFGAREILSRAYGKHNLSGHIDRNFHGVRQFLLAFPEELSRLASLEETYSLSRDLPAKQRLEQFVVHHAADESGFSVDTWRTYLPDSCGGKATSGGATIGNLNYMLPLVAKYLVAKIASKR